jgi:hypothetical protein
MLAFEPWLASRGPVVAATIEERRQPICEAVSDHLAAQFESLCFDPDRPDAETFQRRMFRETPIRLHRLLQVALRLRSLSVIEREYRWTWGILPRFGVTARHMHALVRSYFSAARSLSTILAADRPYFDQLETNLLVIIDRAATVEQMRSHQPSRSLQTNGHALKG